MFTILIALCGSIIWFSFKNGISPTPTSLKVKRAFLHSLPQHLEGIILELGAGWGSLAFPLAKQYPECTVIAYENSWMPYFFCKLRNFFRPYSNLKIVYGDLFDASLWNVTLIVCYLYPGAMKKLKQKLEREADYETIIASHTFAIIGWKPFFKIAVNDLYQTPIYHYRKPHLGIE